MPILPAISHARRKPAAPRTALRIPAFSRFTRRALPFFLCLSVCTARGIPNWQEPEAALRVAGVKENAEDRHVLIDVPANDQSKPVDGLRCLRQNGDRCPAKVVFRTEDTLTVLVDVRNVALNEVFNVYARTGGEPIKVADADAEPFDGNPLRSTAYKTSGQEPPGDVAGFLLMAQRRDRRNVVTADCRNFEDAMDRTVRRLGRSWDRPMIAQETTSWMVTQEPGRYQFRLRNGGGAFLRVNGQVVAAKEDDPGNSQWFSGEAVALPAGVHRVEILTCSKRNFAAVEMGWRRVERGGDEAAGGVLFATGGAWLAGRAEWRDDAQGLFATASAEVGESYGFSGVNTVFYPVQLKAFTENYGDGKVEGRWLDARGLVLGDQPRMGSILAEAGAAARVTLEARRDDGRVATANLDIPLSGVALKEYAVDTWLEGAPAFAFPGDAAAPEIHLRMNSKDAMAFDVEAVLKTRKANETRVRARVHLVDTWGRLELPAVKAGDIEAVAWFVYHAGVVVQHGAWRFVDAADARGLGVNGDRLTLGDAGVTLVARRASWEGAPAADGNGPLVILDGAGYAKATPADGWLGLDGFGGAEGDRRLLPFAGVKDLPQKSRVAVIPPWEDLRAPWQRDAHQRWLSALCGVLRGAGHGVVLVTLPYNNPGNPRAHQELVFKVADAWGVGIADAYSYYATHPHTNSMAQVETLVRQAFGERTAK